MREPDWIAEIDEQVPGIPISLNLLGIVAGVLYGVVFAGLGVMVHEDLLLAATSGVLFGVGSFLMLPVLLSGSVQEASDEADDTFDDPYQETESIGAKRGPIGFGLETAGIVVFMVPFLGDALFVPGLIGAVVVGSVGYVVGSLTLFRHVD